MAGGLYDLFSRQMNEMDERPYSSTDMSYDERDLVDGDRNRLDRSLNKGRYDDDYDRSRSGRPFAETVVNGERGDRVSGSHYRDVGDHTVTRDDRATYGNDASMDDSFGGFLRDDISGYPASRSDARYDGFSEAQRGGPLQNDVSRVPFDGVSRNAAIPMVPQGWPPLPPVTVYFAEVTVPDEILIQGNVTATLIGPKGSNVKEWQKETGARISIQGTNPFHLEDGSRTNSGGRLRVVINAATLSSKNTAVQKVSEYIEWYRDFPDAVREYLAEKRNEVFLGERAPQPSAPTTTSDSSAAAAVTSSTLARSSSGGAKCADCGSEKHNTWKNSEGANQNVKKLKTEIDEVINAIKLLSSHLPEFSAVSDVLSTNVSSSDVGHLRRRFRDLLPTIETVSKAGKSLAETGESLEGLVCKNWVRQPSPEVEMTDGERRESARAKLNDDNLRELAKVVDLLSMLSQGKDAAAPEPPPQGKEKENHDAPAAVVAAAVNVPASPSPRRPPPPPPPPRPPQPQRESSPDIPPAPLLSSTSSSSTAPVQQKGAPPAPALDEVNLSLLSKVMDALSNKTVAESLGAILEAQKGRKVATKSRARSRSPPPARADSRSNSRREVVEEEEDEEAQVDNDYGYDNDEMDDHFFSKNVSHRRWIPQQQPPPPSRSFRSRSRSRSLSSRHRVVTAAVLRRRRSPASPSPSSKRLRRHRSRPRTPSRSRSGSRRRGGRRSSRSRSRSRSRSASPSRRRTGRRYESPPRQVNRTSNNVGGSQGTLGNVDPASYVIPLPPSRWDDDDEDDYPPPQAPLRLQYI